MAHFAKLNENNVVIAVHVVHNNELNDGTGQESEAKGVLFLTNLYGYDNWKQTSYNGTIRKNYAGIGYTYDASRDAFIPPKPYNSWVLNETSCQWEAPVPMPADAGTGEPPKRYTWDETTVSWVEAA